MLKSNNFNTKSDTFYTLANKLIRPTYEQNSASPHFGNLNPEN